MSDTFRGERAVVVGLGVAGASAARVLADEGAVVGICELRADASLPVDLAEVGVALAAGPHDPSQLDGATLVVASPGVPPHAPILVWARGRNLPIWGELELGARLARMPYLAVTGTNGKTTTTGMLAACLRAAGLDVRACGNIGDPFPAAARGPHDALVVEASSFQLALQSSFHPVVSILLNLAPDHLDWHGSFEAYAEAKAAIFARQADGEVHVGNRDDADAARLSRRAPCEVRWFTLGEPAVGDAGYLGRELTGRWTEDPSALGVPRLETAAMRADAAASAAAAHAFGIGDEAIREGLASFTPARHRGETVTTVDGVRFVDNSKATNPHATIAALDPSQRTILIAGGDPKGVALDPIRVLAPHLSGVVAIGASADEVVEIFQPHVLTRKAGSIEEATRTAFELAPRPSIVLLAPACASWDMFTDYEERGDRFAAAARSIEEEVRT